MRWQGCLTFPHGCGVTCGFLVSIFAAFACTLYTALSCRFVKVDFVSDRGDFQDMYVNPREGGELQAYTIGAGLFQWLDSRQDSADYTNGECVGYTELQRDGFGDNTFAAVRFLSTFSVVMSILCVLWGLALSCWSFGKCHLLCLSMLLLLECILVSLTLLTLDSGLCQEVGYSSSCNLDNGAFVAIAAAISWLVSFIVAFCFIQTIENVDYSQSRRVQPPIPLATSSARNSKQARRQSRARSSQQLRASQRRASQQQNRSLTQEQLKRRRQIAEARSRQQSRSTPPRSPASTVNTSATATATPTVGPDDEVEVFYTARVDATTPQALGLKSTVDV